MDICIYKKSTMYFVFVTVDGFYYYCSIVDNYEIFFLVNV